MVSPIGATQVIATQGIGLAVIDLNMPVMRGDRFIALVRSWDRIRDMPVVLISGESFETIRAAAATLRGVTVVTKAEMNERLVPTVGALLRAGGEGSASNKLSTSPGAVRPEGAIASRTLNSAARNALTAWREFIAGRASSTKVVAGLAPCRAEAQQLALLNTSQLLGVAMELTGDLTSASGTSTELDTTMTELLTQLTNGDLEKLRSFDRSLAVNVHRSRLERARS
jgi:CheY-like chemotaxis protein